MRIARAIGHALTVLKNLHTNANWLKYAFQVLPDPPVNFVSTEPAHTQSGGYHLTSGNGSLLITVGLLILPVLVSLKCIANTFGDMHM